MRIQPQSTVDLYSGVDIDFPSGIEIAFSSLANQNTYFASKRVMRETPCTVVKKTGRIRLEVAGSVVKNCNYISFINPSFENKVIYGMILDYNYINNECTEISYQIDFWQTWMFDIDFEKSGIVRQYLNETDYANASANPYNKDIYAFQTPEQLPSVKSLEKYNYTTTISGGTDDYMTTSGINVDGCYPMIMKNYGTDINAIKSLQGNDMCFVVLIAPIDFTAIGGNAGRDYGIWADDVRLGGGTFIGANDKYFTTNVGTKRDPVYKNHAFWSAFPHPYDIWIIPNNIKDGQDELYIDKLINGLTTWNAIGQIIGMYAIPKYLIDYIGVTNSGTADEPGTFNYNFDDTVEFLTSYNRMNKSSYQGYKPHCQKLYLSPYSYLRVETPDGTVKEYQYENFKDINSARSISTTGIIYLKVIVEILGRPKSILMPLKYKDVKLLGTGEITEDEDFFTPDTAGNFNVEERVEINNYPQVPFTTDAFLTHLSATYMNEVANNTSQAQAEREYGGYQRDLAMNSAGYDMINEGRIGSTIGGAVEGFAKGGPIGAFIGAGGGYLGGMRAENDVLSRAAAADFAYENTYGVQKEMLAEASNFLSNPSKDNPRFNDTKPAFANNQYHPGSMGDTSYLKFNALNDFKITQVTLRDTILQKYDEYFKTYGYNFGATVDVPYVVKYTQGASSNDDLPHWEQVNGKDSTFVKTHDCHITHSMLPVAVAIEGMFNCGVRMLKGETL